MREIVSLESSRQLAEYLSFRHLVRNVYAFQFDPERIGRLVQGLQTIFLRIRTELESFASFLERLNSLE